MKNKTHRQQWHAKEWRRFIEAIRTTTIEEVEKVVRGEIRVENPNKSPTEEEELVILTWNKALSTLKSKLDELKKGV